jgi:hypothetical protein
MLERLPEQGRRQRFDGCPIRVVSHAYPFDRRHLIPHAGSTPASSWIDARTRGTP